MWKTELSRDYLGTDPNELRLAITSLDQEIAQLLTELSTASTDPDIQAAYLVRGFHLIADLEGSFIPEFPAFEIRGTGIGWSDDAITLTVQSAFQRFTATADYQAAHAVAQSCPEAFVSPGLRGWRKAVEGFLNPAQAEQHFREAAAEFASDTQPEQLSGKFQTWSSNNIELWSGYFNARARVAEILRRPTGAEDLIQSAQSMLRPEHSGWRSPQVECFRAVLNVIDQIFSGADADIAARQAKDTILGQHRLGWHADDQHAMEFFESVAEAFSELRRNPPASIASGRIPAVLQALGRITLFGREVAEAIQQSFGEAVTRRLSTGDTTWIYRTIRNITDESQLQELLLRLLEAQLPEYAQIRHGPLEYGKDIAALIEVNKRLILQMYQVKAGDIVTLTWRQTAPQLEEMFLVDIPSLQLPAEPHGKEGILIFNGHFNTFVEPVATGWRDEQARDHDRFFRFMHLNSIVNWIVGKGLVGELRAALTELGIPRS